MWSLVVGVVGLEMSASQVAANLFAGRSTIDQLVSRCATNVVFDDLTRSEPLVGRDALRNYLRQKWPQYATRVVERVTDGDTSAGCTWHREDARNPGAVGLRGTLLVELDDAGAVQYVCDGCEPLFKPGPAIEALLRAATASQASAERPAPTYTPRVPQGARDAVDYLWTEAYPGGAGIDEALKLFSDDIRYEDFNYEEPFVGTRAVTDFLKSFDIPGVEFCIRRRTVGDAACVFTWVVRLNDQDGPRGISFYGLDAAKKISYIRDIPAPSIKPPPLGTLAGLINPELCTFGPRETSVGL